MVLVGPASPTVSRRLTSRSTSSCRIANGSNTTSNDAYPGCRFRNPANGSRSSDRSIPVTRACTAIEISSPKYTSTELSLDARNLILSVYFPLRLLVKFNILFILLFGIGVGITALIANSFLRHNARAQVVQQAQLMMSTASANRRYTSEQIKPLLEPHQKQIDRFLPQTVPAFAAINTFGYLQKSYPEYSYREATLNPTNLADRAVDWEADVINYFRNHADEKLLIGERDTPTGRTLYLGQPIRAAASCLVCHSTPDVAPVTMIRAYGREHGFGWKQNEVVSAQIVSVPMLVPQEIAGRAFGTLIGALAGTTLITLLIIDAALIFWVIRPVAQLAHAADRISKGDLDVPELPVVGSDEISELKGSFNRMYVSLVKAIRLLEE